VSCVGTPLTAYQRDIWAASSYFPDLPQFNVVVYDRFAGAVDLEVMRDCLHRAVQRNDALQLRFDERDGAPYQWPESSYPEIRIIDFSQHSDLARARTDWMNQSFDTPLQLIGRRPFDLVLLRESESVTYVYLKAHHIIADGWALNLFMAQVRADYDHVLRTGRPLDIDTPSYLACVESDEKYRRSPEYERDRDFYRAELSDISPALFVRKAADGSRRSARHSFSIERGVIDRIRALGQSPFAFLSAAFAVYLSRIHGTDEIVLGVPMPNRHTESEKETGGQFANTAPLRVRTPGQESMLEIAANIRAATSRLKNHERLALVDALRELPPHAPGQLFDVTISYLRWPPARELPGVTYQTVVQGRAHDQDALAVVVNELDDVSDVVVDLDYACDIFDADFPIEAAARHVETLLRNGLDLAEQPSSSIPMLAPAERDELVRSRNDTRTP
jgi:hypothetical protein